LIQTMWWLQTRSILGCGVDKIIMERG
jgi:hypothetical protein